MIDTDSSGGGGGIGAKEPRFWLPRNPEEGRDLGRTPSEFKITKARKAVRSLCHKPTTAMAFWQEYRNRCVELILLLSWRPRPLHYVLDALLLKGPLKSPRESGSFVPDAKLNFWNLGGCLKLNFYNLTVSDIHSFKELREHIFLILRRPLTQAAA